MTFIDCFSFSFSHTRRLKQTTNEWTKVWTIVIGRTFSIKAFQPPPSLLAVQWIIKDEKSGQLLHHFTGSSRFSYFRSCPYRLSAVVVVAACNSGRFNQSSWLCLHLKLGILFHLPPPSAVFSSFLSFTSWDDRWNLLWSAHFETHRINDNTIHLKSHCCETRQ